MALGASRGNVFALVLRHGVRLAAVGILIGVVLSFAVTQIVRSFLYNVTPTDPLSFIGTAVFLATVAVLAGYLPARRATAVDPIQDFGPASYEADLKVCATSTTGGPRYEYD